MRALYICVDVGSIRVDQIGKQSRRFKTDLLRSIATSSGLDVSHYVETAAAIKYRWIFNIINDCPITYFFQDIASSLATTLPMASCQTTSRVVLGRLNAGSRLDLGQDRNEIDKNKYIGISSSLRSRN